MKNLAERFLTPAEQEKVTQAVQKAELQTSGEIVPMIVSSSNDYPQAQIIATFFLSLPLTLLATHLLSNYLWIDSHNIYFFLLIQMPFLVLCYLFVSTFPWTIKPFIPKEAMAIEVEEEAIKSFYGQRLYKTKEANGILLFISVYERKAWVLADFGINAKIDQEQWQTIIESLTAEIKKGNHCEALCTAIAEIGNILRHHFPYKRNDTDELHNLIIR